MGRPRLGLRRLLRSRRIEVACHLNPRLRYGQGHHRRLHRRGHQARRSVRLSCSGSELSRGPIRASLRRRRWQWRQRRRKRRHLLWRRRLVSRCCRTSCSPHAQFASPRHPANRRSGRCPREPRAPSGTATSVSMRRIRPSSGLCHKVSAACPPVCHPDGRRRAGRHRNRRLLYSKWLRRSTRSSRKFSRGRSCSRNPPCGKAVLGPRPRGRLAPRALWDPRRLCRHPPCHLQPPTSHGLALWALQSNPRHPPVLRRETSGHLHGRGIIEARRPGRCPPCPRAPDPRRSVATRKRLRSQGVLSRSRRHTTAADCMVMTVTTIATARVALAPTATSPA
mmetsp:Transcript_34582/g.95242  ORF Transcript_34582/g.95242 Transcript_34582/m.95242 type:complete len:337 (+) Transcript_34582:555-1565(+)